MGKMNFKNSFIKLGLQPLRLFLVECNICDGKRSIKTDYDGWIKCPACEGEGKISKAQWLVYYGVRKKHDERVKNNP